MSTSPISPFGPRHVSTPIYPSPVNAHKSHESISHTPHYARYTRTIILKVSVPRVIGLATDTGRHDRRQRQNCLARYVSGLVDSGAGGSRFCYDETEDVHIPSFILPIPSYPHYPWTIYSPHLLALDKRWICKLFGSCSGPLAHTCLLDSFLHINLDERVLRSRNHIFCLP